VVVIGEYQARDWGAGGHDFNWYCTDNPEAHVGEDPVYISNRDELIALMGPAAYAEVARMCKDREALLASVTFGAALLPHPADPPVAKAAHVPAGKPAKKSAGKPAKKTVTKATGKKPAKTSSAPASSATTVK
jgi:hypothetical protein